MRKDDGIDRARACCADALEGQPFLLKQSIKYPPGESAMTTNPLQGKVDNLLVGDRPVGFVSIRLRMRADRSPSTMSSFRRPTFRQSTIDRGHLPCWLTAQCSCRVKALITARLELDFSPRRSGRSRNFTFKKSRLLSPVGWLMKNGHFLIWFRSGVVLTFLRRRQRSGYDPAMALSRRYGRVSRPRRCGISRRRRARAATP